MSQELLGLQLAADGYEKKFQRMANDLISERKLSASLRERNKQYFKIIREEAQPEIADKLFLSA